MTFRQRKGNPEYLDLIKNDSRKAFDLNTGPLYRLFLYKISEEEFFFYCAIHHIVFDGWSWKIFINDLNQIYQDIGCRT